MLKIEIVVLLLTSPLESGKKGDTVGLFRRWLTSQICHGRHHIPEGTDVITLRTRFNLARPAGKKGSINSPLVQISFDSTQRAIGIPEIGIVSALPVSAIVTAKKDQGIFVHAQLGYCLLYTSPSPRD